MSFLEKPRFLAILVVTVAALELVMFLMKTYEGSPDLLVLAKGTQGSWSGRWTRARAERTSSRQRAMP